jgi:hypothetical protein
VGQSDIIIFALTLAIVMFLMLLVTLLKVIWNFYKSKNANSKLSMEYSLNMENDFPTRATAIYPQYYAYLIAAGLLVLAQCFALVAPDTSLTQFYHVALFFIRG